MKLCILLTAIVCVLGCVVCAHADPITYSPTDDYLTNANNPNGTWTYGYHTGSLTAESFTAFEHKTDWGYRDGAKPELADLIAWQRSDINSDPSFIVNQSASVIDAFGFLWQPNKLAIDSFSLEPYANPVLRWQAPQAGTVDISATFTDMGSLSCTANIIDNSLRPLFSASTTGGVSYSNPSSIYVDAGDSIYIRTVGGNVAQLDATVSLTPGAIAPIPAELNDFSTDPNLATEWTTATFYDPLVDGCPNSTASWNETTEKLDLVSSNEEGLRMLSQTGTTRTATDTVTLEISDYVSSDPTEPSNWTACGLLLSSERTPYIFNGTAQYAFSLERNNADDFHVKYGRGGEPGGTGLELVKQVFETMPSNVKLDVVYDSNTSEFVFLLNDVEFARDGTYTSEELPYYSVYWGGSATDTLSVSVDDFGIGAVTSLPGDANRDGVVDADDASVLASNWQSSGADWSMGDFNNDGLVNDIDATILASNWQVSASNAVPEPSAVVSMLVGLISLLACGYRRSK